LGFEFFVRPAECFLGVVPEASDDLGAFVLPEVVGLGCLVGVGDFSGLANTANDNWPARDPITVTTATHGGILLMIDFSELDTEVWEQSTQLELPFGGRV